MNHNNFKQFSEIYIKQIDSFISDFFKNKIENSDLEFIKELYGNLREFCLRPGKRIRPLLLLMGYLGYDGDGDKIDDIIKIASVLEIMHSFLLVHDDIIDKSILRRGDKTIHLIAKDKYQKESRSSTIGNDIGIILGDILCFNTIEIISGIKLDPVIKDRFLKLYSTTYEKTAWGQILDIINTMPVNIITDKDIPLQISLMKTSYYTITNPILMGYILTGKHDEKEQQLIRKFSTPLGLAFQIRDDILGVFGSNDDMGKSSSSDIEESKYTLLIAITIEKLMKEERDDFLSIFLKDSKQDDDIEYIKQKIRDTGGLNRSISDTYMYIEESVAYLKKTDFCKETKNLLFELIDNLKLINIDI